MNIKSGVWAGSRTEENIMSFFFYKIVVTDCVESCQNDNCQCNQWRKYHPNAIYVFAGPCYLGRQICLDIIIPFRSLRNVLCRRTINLIPFQSVRFSLSRANSRFAPSQWETTLLCNDVSLWQGANQPCYHMRYFMLMQLLHLIFCVSCVYIDTGYITILFHTARRTNTSRKGAILLRKLIQV